MPPPPPAADQLLELAAPLPLAADLVLELAADQLLELAADQLLESAAAGAAPWWSNRLP